MQNQKLNTKISWYPGQAGIWLRDRPRAGAEEGHEPAAAATWENPSLRSRGKGVDASVQGSSPSPLERRRTALLSGRRLGPGPCGPCTGSLGLSAGSQHLDEVLVGQTAHLLLQALAAPLCVPDLPRFGLAGRSELSLLLPHHGDPRFHCGLLWRGRSSPRGLPRGSSRRCSGGGLKWASGSIGGGAVPFDNTGRLAGGGGAGPSQAGGGGGGFGAPVLGTGFGKLLKGLTGLVVLAEAVVDAADHGGARERPDGRDEAEEPSALELRSLPNQTFPGCELLGAAFPSAGGSAGTSSPETHENNHPMGISVRLGQIRWSSWSVGKSQDAPPGGTTPGNLLRRRVARPL